MADKINIGSLDVRISIYKKEVSSTTTTGETIKADVLLKETWASRYDKSSNEEEEGKIYLVAVREYVIRYNSEIVQDGETMFIRDVDGDYNIYGIEQIGRKDYLRLNAVKRE